MFVPLGLVIRHAARVFGDIGDRIVFFYYSMTCLLPMSPFVPFCPPSLSTGKGGDRQGHPSLEGVPCPPQPHFSMLATANVPRETLTPPSRPLTAARVSVTKQFMHPPTRFPPRMSPVDLAFQAFLGGVGLAITVLALWCFR